MTRIFEGSQVFLIGESQVNRQGMNDLLEAVGAVGFKTDAATGSEELAEVGGRLCYLSFAPGLNPNVTRVREGNVPYIGNILKSGHGSVIEHGVLNFAFLDVTPVLTHELVRHRVGTGFSQQSGRYCRITEIGFYYGDAYTKARMAGLITQAVEDMISNETMALLEHMEAYQKMVAEAVDIDHMADFTMKKVITSQMRRLAPYGIQTSIMFSANHRALRHIIDVRNSVHAEEEVYKTFHKIGGMVKDRYAAIYQDMHLSSAEMPWGPQEFWAFDNHKV